MWSNIQLRNLNNKHYEKFYISILNMNSIIIDHLLL